MMRLVAVVVGIAVSFSAVGQQSYEEHAVNITAQVLNFDSCIDAFAERYSSADASPSEIATSALYECGVYHDRMLAGVRAMVLDMLPPGVTEEHSALDERMMATTLDQYQAVARDQRAAANERAINIVVKRRTN